MDSRSETKEIYQTHRDNQRERILEAAEKLFIQEGIDHVSMSAIAGAARISRRTLYQYFSDKQEIAWAIFEKMIEPWHLIGTAQPRTNGHQQIQQFMDWMINQLENNRDHLRFIVELDALYSRETNADRMRQVTGRLNAETSQDPVTRMVLRGIEDGSIRSDVQPDLIAAALLNLLSGMNARFALLGNLITQEYGSPMLSIYREICRVFLSGLQPKP